MRAIAYSRYGSPEVLHTVTLPRPTPKPGELLIRVRATSVTAGDYRARSLDMPAGFALLGRLVFGLFRPRRQVLGTEFAGVVEAVGSDVTRFAAGDRIFAYPGAAFGGYAEFAVLPETAAIAPIPDNLDFDAAAAMSFGGATALNFLRDKGNIKPGDHVLIIGASGGVGSALCNWQKTFGAHVTATASTGKLDMVGALGADAVLDHSRQNPAAAAEAYDIILDTSGTATYSRYGASLKPDGRLLLVSANLWQMIGSLLARKTGGRKAIPGYAPESAEELRFLADLAAQGRFTPYIDRRFEFSQMAMAHAHFQSPEKKGNVVVVMDTA